MYKRSVEGSNSPPNRFDDHVLEHNTVSLVCQTISEDSTHFVRPKTYHDIRRMHALVLYEENALGQGIDGRIASNERVGGTVTATVRDRISAREVA